VASGGGGWSLSTRGRLSEFHRLVSCRVSQGAGQRQPISIPDHAWVRTYPRPRPRGRPGSAFARCWAIRFCGLQAGQLGAWIVARPFRDEHDGMNDTSYSRVKRLKTGGPGLAPPLPPPLSDGPSRSIGGSGPGPRSGVTPRSGRSGCIQRQSHRPQRCFFGTRAIFPGLRYRFPTRGQLESEHTALDFAGVRPLGSRREQPTASQSEPEA
jgi:hypothetical protein